MVRFIINKRNIQGNQTGQFTFQYGQIYYLLQFFKSRLLVVYLHSNMVRFIILKPKSPVRLRHTFTFQYGQIYYLYFSLLSISLIAIYIPIWLDLLSTMNMGDLVPISIYIPIWLDLLQKVKKQIKLCILNLHSNMVRFIIKSQMIVQKDVNLIYIPIWLDLLLMNLTTKKTKKKEFTFQYGQIYYDYA